MQAEKKIMKPQFPIFRLIFQRWCDDYQCLICIFCHILRLMGIYRVGAPSEYLKSFVPSFLFFLFFPFLFFIFFFVFFSGAPLALGPLDIVHPCHPVATPLIETIITELRCRNYILNLYHFKLSMKSMSWSRGCIGTFCVPANTLCLKRFTCDFNKASSEIRVNANFIIQISKYYKPSIDSFLNFILTRQMHL